MPDTAVASPIKSEHSTRKNKKPLMEKRRRARINSCLTQLKSLVLQAIKKDSSQFSKLEKADILELTVKHLRALQRQQAAGVMTSDESVVSKYRAGFNECAKEVMRYMGSVPDVKDGVKQEVMTHLAGCLQVVNQVTPTQTFQQQQQQSMKPLHVHIPQASAVGAPVPTVILPTPHQTAAAPPALSFLPSPAGSCSSSSSSPVSSPGALHSASPVQSASGGIGAPSPSQHHHPHHVSGAFQIVPSSACPGGAVALYLGGGAAGSMSRGTDSLSVGAVPLYSVALPQADGGVTAFVPPASMTSSPTSQPRATPSFGHSSDLSRRVANTSPVKADSYPPHTTPLPLDFTHSTTSLPVDLRQKVKSNQAALNSHLPVSVAQYSPASLSDEKLWRPW